MAEVSDKAQCSPLLAEQAAGVKTKWWEVHELFSSERGVGKPCNEAGQVENENEAMKIVHAEEMTTVREDNHVLKEEVERLKGEMKGLRGELELLARLVAQKCGTNPHSTVSITTAKVERPKPGAAKSEGSARENFHSREKDRGRGSRAVLKFTGVGDRTRSWTVRRRQCLWPRVKSQKNRLRHWKKLAVRACRVEAATEGEVGCVSEPAADSPREVVLPKQERPRQPRSRKRRKSAKPREWRSHLATRTGKVLEHSRRLMAKSRMDKRKVWATWEISRESEGEVAHGN
ncbi:hypothetical protein GH714_010749 [Hevea brasiliensis]|uniref:Uncharacterized protein n=1 Tax=Hevea brasiliensis TaxID=3981 RepID=A0A6A6MX63_HEVBR|nr:hypothetical protein GH714_010749 [Hevea brasiliensis]